VAKKQTAFSTVPKGSTLQFAPATVASNLVQVSAKGVVTPHADAANDPIGYKNWIAHDVAHGIYPNGAGVDPNQDISDDVATNSDIRANQINFYATLDAKKLGYTWTPVTATDVGKLKTVLDLMTLIVARLS
jgi:hypothetical protein